MGLTAKETINEGEDRSEEINQNVTQRNIKKNMREIDMKNRMI